MPFLHRTVVEHFARAKELVAASPKTGPLSNHSPEFEKEMSAYYNGLHWTLLLAGFVIADAGDGETPSVPTSLALRSAQMVRAVSVRGSLTHGCRSRTTKTSLSNLASSLSLFLTQ